MTIDNNFCYFLKYLCSPEKGCFSCVALKRAVFCKRCYWFTGVWCQWSLPEILVAEAFLQTTWAICVWIFQGKFVSILIVDSRICLFDRLRFFSVFCIIFVTLDSFLSQLVIRILLLLPLWQNLITFRSMIVFLFYRCHLRQTFKPTDESCIFVHIILQETEEC